VTVQEEKGSKDANAIGNKMARKRPAKKQNHSKKKALKND